MKDDEKALYDALVERGVSDEPTVFVVAMSLSIPFSRAEKICRAWAEKGVFEFDGVWGHGWLINQP